MAYVCGSLFHHLLRGWDRASEYDGGNARRNVCIQMREQRGLSYACSFIMRETNAVWVFLLPRVYF